MPRTPPPGTRRRVFHHRLIHASIGAGLLTLGAGCVPKARYEQASLDLAAANTQIALLAKRLEESEHNRAAEAEVCAALEAGLKECDAERLRLRDTDAELHVALQTCRENAERLRMTHPGVEADREVYFQLVEQLQPLITTGVIEVRIENRHIVLRLRADSTFEGAALALVPEAARLFERIAEALVPLEDRRFRVEVGTDDEQVSPEASSYATSGLDFSARRAAVVVEALIAGGLKPDRVSAVGLGAARPLVLDASPEGRARNRRIDIVVEHRLEDLPPLKDGFPDAAMPETDGNLREDAREGEEVGSGTGGDAP